MLEAIIVSRWLKWHYIDMPWKIFEAAKNYLRFGFRYFSIAFLFKTLFSPWHKYQFSYPKSFSFYGYFETFMSNLISRVLGAVVRIFLILFGLLFELFLLFFFIPLFLFWLLFPIICFIIIIYGIRFLF